MRKFKIWEITYKDGGGVRQEMRVIADNYEQVAEFIKTQIWATTVSNVKLVDEYLLLAEV